MRSHEPAARGFLKYFLAWFPVVIIAFANATVRQVIYRKYVGEPAAHQLSTLTLCVLVGVYAWVLSRHMKLKSSSQAIGVGLIWLIMTIAFETGLGHYVLGNPWSEVLRDYDISEGRVWPFFLLWLTIAPYVFDRFEA